MTIETPNHETAIRKCEGLATLVDQHTDSSGSGVHATAIEPLKFLRQSDTSTAIPAVTEPMLAIVVQGKAQLQSKRVVSDRDIAISCSKYALLSISNSSLFPERG